MDWISTLIGALSGGGISAILLFKQNKSSATADAIDKLLANIATQTDSFDKVLKSKDVMIEQLNGVINQKSLLAEGCEKEIYKLKRESSEFSLNIATMTRQVKGLQEQMNKNSHKLKEYEERTKYAESNICEVLGCDLRKPRLGTFKPKLDENKQQRN